ncbi:MAG: hypothetical protein JSR89_17090 [Proteobacteria bacterium]|nr:hypothetical protein [Pseudomonadota bacterium]
MAPAQYSLAWLARYQGLWSDGSYEDLVGNRFGSPSTRGSGRRSTFLAPNGQRQGREGFNPRGAGSSGPVPVVVQSMPKGLDKPPVINISQVVNVTQTNASGAEIAGAVGSATKAAATGALHDVHH